jgi:hypothetical protein
MSNRNANLRGVDPVLTTLAVGYSNADFIADQVFPMAEMPAEGNKIPRFGKQLFKQFSTERALRAKSNVLNPDDSDMIQVNLTEHDLAVPMDYREQAEAAVRNLDLEASNTVLAQEGIALRREKISADIAFNPNNYAASNRVALTGLANQFDVDGSDPIGPVFVGREVIRKSIARNPNAMVIGASVRARLANHPRILERLPAGSVGVVTDDLLKAVYQVNDIYTGNAIWVTDDGQTVNDVWGDSILLFYKRPAQANTRRTVYEPNYGYTCYKTVQGVTASVDKYLAEGNKVEFVRSTMIFSPVLTGADGAYLLTDVLRNS